LARRFRTRIPLTATAGARARRFLEPLRSRLDPWSFESLRLLVTELVNNSLKHSGRPEGDPVVLTVEVEDKEVWAEVVDRGRGGLVKRSEPGHESESGWGLQLLDRLAHAWGFSTDGLTRVWFVLVTNTNGQVRDLTPPWSRGSHADSA
jgi:anti-sigma regulatory factor (Ser/Thr protein kinase)